MSNLENDRLTEKLVEAFDVWADDYDTRNYLAEVYLEGTEYYSFCKDDNQDLLHSHLDDLYLDIEHEFFNRDVPCFDIQELYESISEGE